MTHLNIGTKKTSTVAGLKEKISQLSTMIIKEQVKGKKLITAKRNLAWYKSELKTGFRRNSKRKLKKRASVSNRSKAKRSRS